MTIVFKDKDLVVPPTVRRQAGIKTGDRLEFKVSGGVIIIVPELPNADDEYTPEQRRYIDARLEEASRGPYYGPFKTASAAVKFLDQRIGARKTRKRKTI